MHLTAISSWVRGTGLEIVLLVTGTILLTRIVTWIGARTTDRIDANAQETDALVRSEASKHRHALAQVITWVTLVIIYCTTAVAIASRLGIPITGLVAPAAVVAVALGFGAQRIVQDILAGFFIITERQYGFGDLISLSVPNSGNPATGTVEDVTLRITTVRTAGGEVVITPNGQITQVTNLSRAWARRASPWATSRSASSPGRCPASNSRSAGSCGPGSRPGSGARASACPQRSIPWTRAGPWARAGPWTRAGPTDAAGADLDLDPDRDIRAHPGDLRDGQAPGARHHRGYPAGATHRIGTGRARQ